VVTEGSEITFTVGEVLSRFPTPIEAVLRTSKLSGQINLDGQPSTVEVDLHSLNSDQQYRDRYVKLQMFPQHPVATFTVDSVNELPGEFDSGDTFQRSVSGTLNVKGAEFPISFDLEVRNDGNILNVLGRTVFTWQQLSIPVPTARSVVSIDDEVHVEILLVAKPN
jgi:polyisoprenoid-binding protein YceI